MAGEATSPPPVALYALNAFCGTQVLNVAKKIRAKGLRDPLWSVDADLAHTDPAPLNPVPQHTYLKIDGKKVAVVVADGGPSASFETAASQTEPSSPKIHPTVNKYNQWRLHTPCMCLTLIFIHEVFEMPPFNCFPHPVLGFEVLEDIREDIEDTRERFFNPHPLFLPNGPQKVRAWGGRFCGHGFHFRTTP